MAGTLHLTKLCVGVASVEELEDWQRRRWGEERDVPARHVTRMWPRRAEELLDGGSLYWVIKGVIMARQRILGLEEALGEDGIRRCAILLGRDIVRTRPAPRRAFQGWRYLTAADAPADLPERQAAEDPLPAALSAELAEIGIL